MRVRYNASRGKKRNEMRVLGRWGGEMGEGEW
jgi:hypothetical protein